MDGNCRHRHPRIAIGIMFAERLDGSFSFHCREPARAAGITLLFGANGSQVIGCLLQIQTAIDPLREFRPLNMLLQYPMTLLLNSQTSDHISLRSICRLWR